MTVIRIAEGLLQKRRGLGMFVTDGAQQKLLSQERGRFMEVELPSILERMNRLGISEQDVVEFLTKKNSDTES